jgi:hypothetical protein
VSAATILVAVPTASLIASLVTNDIATTATIATAATTGVTATAAMAAIFVGKMGANHIGRQTEIMTMRTATSVHARYLPAKSQSLMCWRVTHTFCRCV